MHAVLRIGGSVVAAPIDSKLIEQYAALLNDLVARGHKIVVVVGGGVLAREFIRLGDALNLSETEKDWLAIHVSRLHALLLSLKISPDCLSTIPTTIDDALETYQKNGIAVVGGLEPGMTTDTVAVKIALKADVHLLVKATDQNGIFTKDPKKHEDAEMLNKIGYEDLIELFDYSLHEAGMHQILDPVALKLLKETNIKTVIINGYDPKNVEKAIEGLNVGTIISK